MLVHCRRLVLSMALVAGAAFTLAGCGQKGPLYLVDEYDPEQPLELDEQELNDSELELHEQEQLLEQDDELELDEDEQLELDDEANIQLVLLPEFVLVPSLANTESIPPDASESWTST